MKEKIDHLKRIAKANKDSFRFTIEIDGSKVITYSFCVEENTDDHLFLCVNSDNLDLLKYKITDGLIKKCCKQWNYKYVD